ncbi:MAG: hypothetical protein AAFZ15_12210 [Bacteroidota bacterium]
MKHLFLTFTVLCCLLVFSCNKDDDTTPPLEPNVESFDQSSYSLVIDDIGSSISMDAIGNDEFILTGKSHSDGNNFSDIHLTKLDDQCNVAWTKTFGGMDTEFSNDVYSTNEGGFIVAGTTRGFGAYSIDAYIIKAGADGNEEWSNTYGEDKREIPESIIQMEDGGYLFVGQTEKFTTQDWDAYYVRLDADGNVIWSKNSGRAFNDFAHEVVPTNDNHFVILGTTDSVETFFEHTLTLEKIDADGNTLWFKPLNHLAEIAADYGLAVDDDEGLLIASGRGEDGFGYRGDALLIKTDANGNESWSKSYGGSESDEANIVIKTSDNHIMMLGTSQSYGYGYSDLMVIKTDNKGNQKWLKTYGGSHIDQAYGIEEMANGNFLILGIYATEPQGAVFNTIILKIDKDGQPL